MTNWTVHAPSCATRKFALAAAATLLLATPALAAPPTYTMIFLGSFGGFTDAFGLNNSGQVVGQANLNTSGPTDLRAFLSDGSTTTQLIGGATGSAANDINNSGKLTGKSPYSAVIYDSVTGTVQDLGTLGTPTSEGLGINDNGQVTGWFAAYGTPFSGRAFFYDGTSMHDLGTLGGVHSSGSAINNSGQVVGWAEIKIFAGIPISHAFLYDGTSMQDLGTLGGESSSAWDINDSGQVVGSSRLSDGSVHAFLHDGAAMHDLGTLPGKTTSSASGVNNSGQIVGSSTDMLNNERGFLYDGSVMYDINDLIDPADPFKATFTVRRAKDINDNGEIIVNACSTPPVGCYAFLLKVVPPAPAVADAVPSP